VLFLVQLPRLTFGPDLKYGTTVSFLSGSFIWNEGDWWCRKWEPGTW